MTLLAILLPFLAAIGSMVLFWNQGMSGHHLAVMLVMYVLTGMGITLGFHRLFTHSSFQTILPIRVILGVLGSMAVEGPLLKWVATHRRHHQHSDTEEDPHSPHQSGSGLLGVLRGFIHAHMGWLLKDEAPNLERYVGDLIRDRAIMAINRTFVWWVLAGLLLPAAIGGLVSGSWMGALLGLFWGGLVRIFLVHHTTWSINSACHLWGTQPFSAEDGSRNNPIFGILAFGEGWHNNHHAFPTSARHGLRWWEFDITYVMIRILEALKLAWKVKLPTPELLQSKQARRRAAQVEVPSLVGEPVAAS